MSSSNPNAVNVNGVSLMTPALQNAMHNQQLAQDDHRDMPRPYECPICHKAFHRLEHQTRHIRTHTGEKPHACNFPGCSKRFSRSDELTRHSRIHNNPNSRRGRNQMLVSPRREDAAYTSILDSHRMPPPKTISRSAPSSNLASPNVSPPHHYLPYLPGASNLSPYSARRSGSGTQSPNGLPNGLPRLDLLSTAANHVQDVNNPSFPQSRYAGLGQYSLSAQSMSRSHSHEADDPYSHRQTKKSRPNSPFSTAPPSPTFSHESYSPTPDHTPLATPAHSPRIRPQGWQELQLPTLRSLSLYHAPALAPMEPTTDAAAANMGNMGRASMHNASTVVRVSDLLNRTEPSQRKLPVPQLAFSRSMNMPMIGPESSASSSIAGGDLMDRM